MRRLLKKVWAYLSASGNKRFDELADPAVQLEQALREAQTSHKELTDQAANVIAAQRQAEMRLARESNDLDKLKSNLEAAVRMSADDQEYVKVAESLANRVIQQEQTVESTRAMVLQSAKASDHAKAAVEENSYRLQSVIAEKHKLLSQNEQVKLAERMQQAHAAITSRVGDDVPSFDDIRNRLEARYAKAIGQQELHATSVEGRLQEVERFTTQQEAQALIANVKQQLESGDSE